MKKRSRKARRAAGGELQDGFVRGFVATGLLAALRDGAGRKQVLCAALQGGTALAAAGLAVDALKQRSPAGALSAVAAGAAGLYLIGRLADGETQ
ncbi:hypothetical protein [Azospira restricta]|uniref:Uncharacterized protein n=1 Tax=Azospira restricta TaxID=404405 RepID=A0A974PXU2_9RHOO|nr:hypothetical protein [Azospira restricta]QRJ63171.1 hypothetical protein IWH25_15675 [Azospira restricta]